MGAAAIVLAGGSSTRVGTTVNKVYETVAGRRLLAYSLEVCALAPSVDVCVLVGRPEDRHLAEEVLAGRLGLECLLVDGGSTRHHSEQAGLAAIRRLVEQGVVDVIAIHDAARPLATVDLFERTVATAREIGGAVPGLGFGEPVYDVGGVAPIRHDPSAVARMQTPQAFRAVELLRAYDDAPEGWVALDTAETVERAGELAIAVVAGDPGNVKVTYPTDLVMVEDLARRWRRGRWLDRG